MKSFNRFATRRFVKNFIAIFLITAFALQNFSKLALAFSYEINKEYIAKTLCENRTAPEKKCHGKCQLKKDLKEDERSQNLPSKQLKEFEVLLFIENNKTAINFNAVAALQHIGFYILKPYTAPEKGIYHPPKA